MEAYGEFVGKRQTGLDQLLPQDPRDESEKCAAEELEAKVSVKYCCWLELFCSCCLLSSKRKVLKSNINKIGCLPFR